MAVSQSESLGTGDFKTLLRDVYYSEEFKIDSQFAEKLKVKLDELCSGKIPEEESTAFQHCFSVVEANIKAKKNDIRRGGREISYKDVYLYQAEQVPDLLAKFPPLLTDSLREPILWQMIVERLFGEKPDVAGAVTLTNARELTAVEENAIYYAAGYVVRKLLKKFKRNDSTKAQCFVEALLNMLGDDPSSNTECTSSYTDYVSVWIKSTDRGGLMHVSLDTYRCFKFIEIATYAALKRGEPKEAVISQIVADENVVFHWELVVFIEQQSSHELLQEVVECWFTIRGFSVTSKLFEQYKKAKKTCIRGKKGTRKELHGKAAK